MRARCVYAVFLFLFFEEKQGGFTMTRFKVPCFTPTSASFLCAAFWRNAAINARSWYQVIYSYQPSGRKCNVR